MPTHDAHESHDGMDQKVHHMRSTIAGHVSAGNGIMGWVNLVHTGTGTQEACNYVYVHAYIDAGVVHAMPTQSLQALGGGPEAEIIIEP